jgi:hypothetical protein
LGKGEKENVAGFKSDPRFTLTSFLYLMPSTPQTQNSHTIQSLIPLIVCREIHIIASISKEKKIQVRSLPFK